MDARQNFYNHNRLLYRFLILATGLFIGIVTLLWWQESHRVVQVAEQVSELRHFSAEAAMAEVTRNYAYDTRYIDDLESYPELVGLFFSPSLKNLLGETTLEKRLTEVAEAQAFSTQYGRDHVYHTSYYVGNLLVLPNLSLHELLTKMAVPNTAVLLETALADVRAGTVKIENYYDVAPPTWYRVSTTTTLFYPAPSFPSLTMSETALVFYLLATVDPGHARLYEQQAKVFASQMFTSGTHFRIDIEYAILLAHEYVQIMKDLPPYQELLAKAATEWDETDLAVGESQAGEIFYDFAYPDFPVPSQFALSVVGDTSYKATNRSEELLGSLRLTLVDTRLPQPTLKLYTYDVAGQGQVLPFALDLTTRQFPGLGNSLGYAGYLDADRYVFLSGKARETTRGSYALASSSLFWRDAEVRKIDLQDTDTETLSEPVLSSSGAEFLFTSTDASGDSSVKRGQLVSRGETTVTTIARGHSPAYISSDAIVYIRDGAVFQYDLLSRSETPLDSISPLGHNGSLRFDVGQHMLIVIDTGSSLETLVPTSMVRFYSLSGTSETRAAELRTTVQLTDARVSSVLLSPGGKYLALALTEGQSGRRARVLLYDIMSGIIQEEIDLSPFAPAPIQLDGWTLF